MKCSCSCLVGQLHCGPPRLLPLSRQVLRRAHPHQGLQICRKASQSARRRAPCPAPACSGDHRHSHPYKHRDQHPVSAHVRSEAAEPLEVLLSSGDQLGGSGSWDHSQDDGDGELAPGAGHAHSHHYHGPDLDATPVHRALTWVYRRTGLLQLASLLRENMFGSIAISVMIVVAALAQWQAGSAWLSQRVGHTVSTAATAGIYFLAGTPAAVDLTYDLASLHVDTHVLMTLAVIGTLLIGGAMEVGHPGLAPRFSLHLTPFLAGESMF